MKGVRPWPRRWEAALAEARSVRSRRPGSPGRIVVIEDGAGRLHAGVAVPAEGDSRSGVLAEQVAAARLRLARGGKALRVLVVDPARSWVAPPGGGALQFLREFGPAAEVAWGTLRSMHGRSRVDRLLPLAFADYRRARPGAAS